MFVFESVAMIASENIFHSEIYQNNIFFYFFKIIFDIRALK